MSGPVESELKIPVPSLEPVRSALRRAGATLRHPVAREVNLVFDRGSGELREAERLLRLRRARDRWVLTFKGPATFLGTVKQREELEVVVDDGVRLETIFGRLGYAPVERYEKDREEWELEGLEVALDHTPMGEFVEIEGEPTALDAAARRLGLDPASAARGSYLALWARYREAHPELGMSAHMVFPG